MLKLTIVIGLLVAFAAVSNAVTAVCQMEGVSAVDSEAISGTVTFSQDDDDDTVYVQIQLTGFDMSDNRTYHGFHIHETGSTSDQCSGAGSHFDGAESEGHDHGAPTDDNRHVGDLGNVQEVDGIVSTVIEDTVISLDSDENNYIIGRAVVIHQDEDDLGQGGEDDSKTTGHAGARIGCCVIEAS